MHKARFVLYTHYTPAAVHYYVMGKWHASTEITNYRMIPLAPRAFCSRPIFDNGKARKNNVCRPCVQSSAMASVSATGCTAFQEGAEIVTLDAIVMHLAHSRTRACAKRTLNIFPGSRKKSNKNIKWQKMVSRPLSVRITVDWCHAVCELCAIIYHRRAHESS